MTGQLRFAGAALFGLGLVALTLATATVAAQTMEPYRGRPLADALRDLQAKGLRIVFTSATVPSDLRVTIDPRARTPRQQLDELLAPHGLKASDGPGGIIQVVRAESAVAEPATGTIQGLVVEAVTRVPIGDAVVTMEGMEVRTDGSGRFAIRDVRPGTHTLHASTNGFAAVTRPVHVVRATTVNITLRLTSLGTHRHSEQVTVSRPRPYWHDRAAASAPTLQRGDVSLSAGGLTDDAMHALHTLPRVSVADDLRSDFTVRGSPFRHMSVVVDGVSTPWLQHTAMGRGATGSLSMLTSEIVDEATLRVGAYPRRFGDRLGAELEMTIREGSRERFELQGSLGGTNGTVVAEGPLGRSENGARGSWLVATRQSYLEWPVGRAASARTPFGFADVVGKAVHDVHANHTAGLTVLAGTSNVDGEDLFGAGEIGDGANRTGVVNAFLRSTFSAPVVLTQRAYVVRHRFTNRDGSGRDVNAGANEEIAYRADVARPMFGGLLEAGAHVSRTASASVDAGVDPAGVVAAASSWQRSGYVHGAWRVAPALTISPGLRVTASTLRRRPTMARWILAEYAVGPRWTLNASVGASRQPAELSQAVLEPGPQARTSERSTHVDVSIEQRIGRDVWWQATVFSRREADVLREPALSPRLADGVMIDPARSGDTNSLSGSSRGIELLVNRAAAGGFSGWAAYAYGATRYADADRGETFWADFDRRHAFTAAWTHAFSVRTTVGAVLRAGSGFPIPAYLRADNGVLVVSDRRNQVRLPSYVRLDVRARRTFEALGRRVTVFLDVANVLNRVNLAAARGSIDRDTGLAVGFTDTLLPRRVSAGLQVRF